MSHPNLTSMRPRRFVAHLESLKDEFELLAEEIQVLQKERDEYGAKVEAQAKELQDVRRNFDCERCKHSAANDPQSIASPQLETLETFPSRPVSQSNPLGKPGTSGTSPGVVSSQQSRRSTRRIIQESQAHSAITLTQPFQSVSHTASQPADTAIANSPFVSLPAPSAQPSSLAVNPERNWSIIFSNEVGKELDVEMAYTLFHKKMIQCVKFSQDGKFLAAGCRDGKAYIYDVETGTLTCVLRNLLAKEDSFDSVCFDCNGKYLATGAQDARIYIWDIKTKYVRNAFKGHTDAINTLDFSPNGQLLVSASRDNTVRLWNMRHGASMVWEDDNPSSLGHHYHTSAVFNPDGRYVASSHADGVLRIWDVCTGRLMRNVKAHMDWVLDVAFMPDGKGLVSGSSDKTLEYWDISSLAAIRYPATTQAHLSGVEEKRQPERQFSGHTASVYSLAIAPDGRWIASGSFDKSVRIWDTRNASMQCTLNDSQWVYSVDFSPTGSFLASGGADGVVRIWRYSSRSDVQSTLS